MNRAILIGRLTRDVELRYTQSQMAVASFSVAVQRNYKNADGEYEADFINCKAFDKRAEIISKNFSKGSQIAIEGHIQTGSYDRKDGTKVFTTDVIVDGIDFIESKKESTTETVEPEQVKEDPFKDFGQQIEIDDSDLPF